MARPQKHGLEYFSIDVDVFQDIKVRRLMRYKGGGKAFAVFSVLLCYIYKNGYYLKWDDNLSFIIAETVYCDEKDVVDIVNYCLEIGLFDKKTYNNHCVLTSKGIQKRFLNVSSRRSGEKIELYNLLNEEEIIDAETEVIDAETQVIDAETQVIATETPKNDAKSTQRKEKKSKYIESSLRSDSLSPQAATSQECVVNALGFLDFFNGSIQSTPGCVIPTITQIDRRRMGMLNARSKEYGKEALATVVRKAVASSYLNYGTGQFTASFDWIFRPTNFRKILEGNFDNKVYNSSNTSQNGNNNPDRPTDAETVQAGIRIIARLQAEEDAGSCEVRI